MKHQIIDRCSEALFQAIEVDHALNGSASRSATAVVHTRDGCVELYIDCYGAQAAVIHKREANNTHDLSTLEAAICAAAPEWTDGEDEEQSFIDDGFASQQDFLEYMYR